MNWRNQPTRKHKIGQAHKQKWEADKWQLLLGWEHMWHMLAALFIAAVSTSLLLQFSQIHFGQVHYRFGHIYVIQCTVALPLVAAIATSTLLFSCLCSSIVEKQCLYSRSIGNQLREGGSDPAELIIETEHRDWIKRWQVPLHCAHSLFYFSFFLSIHICIIRLLI